MFNNNLKKAALNKRKLTVKEYNDAYQSMNKACENLYSARKKSIGVIHYIENVINSIAHTPKKFETNISKVNEALSQFHLTEEYAKKAYEDLIKAGKNIAGGAAAGIGIATMAPTALMGIATTFGTATTGTAISALSGAAAQKAALAWIGRTFAGFAVKEGAGMAVGQAFLALAGPIGWGITATTIGWSLFSLSKKNKQLSDKIYEEVNNILKAKNKLLITKKNAIILTVKTEKLINDLNINREKIHELFGTDYDAVCDKDKLFLGSLVNNTLSLSLLLNKTIDGKAEI